MKIQGKQMSVELFKCWNCGKDIHHQMDEANFFWCNSSCKEAHQKKEQEQRIKWEKDVEKAEKAWQKNGVKTKGEHVPDTRYDTKTGKKKRQRKNNENKTEFVGKNTCGKCGLIGHNARTCGNKAPKSDEPVKRAQFVTVVKGKYKCGKCGMEGHNGRTCKV